MKEDLRFPSRNKELEKNLTKFYQSIQNTTRENSDLKQEIEYLKHELRSKFKAKEEIIQQSENKLGTQINDLFTITETLKIQNQKLQKELERRKTDIN